MRSAQKHLRSTQGRSSKLWQLSTMLWALIYNVAVYNDGHKVEYLVCNEASAGSITVTRFLILLDRSGVGRRIEEEHMLTVARQQAISEEACDPINLAIVVLTAGQRAQRGELVNATGLLAAAADMALKMLAITQGGN